MMVNCVCVFTQAGGHVPVLDTLSDMLSRGRAIPVQLEPLERLEALVSEVQAWKESAAKTFLRKNSSFTLLEVWAGTHKSQHLGHS